MNKKMKETMVEPIKEMKEPTMIAKKPRKKKANVVKKVTKYKMTAAAKKRQTISSFFQEVMIEGGLFTYLDKHGVPDQMKKTKYGSKLQSLLRECVKMEDKLAKIFENESLDYNSWCIWDNAENSNHQTLSTASMTITDDNMPLITKLK